MTKNEPVTPARLRQIMQITDHGKKDIYDVALAYRAALEAWVRVVQEGNRGSLPHNVAAWCDLCDDLEARAVELTKAAGVWLEEIRDEQSEMREKQ